MKLRRTWRFTFNEITITTNGVRDTEGTVSYLLRISFEAPRLHTKIGQKDKHWTLLVLRVECFVKDLEKDVE